MFRARFRGCIQIQDLLEVTQSRGPCQNLLDKAFRVTCDQIKRQACGPYEHGAGDGNVVVVAERQTNFTVQEYRNRRVTIVAIVVLTTTNSLYLTPQRKNFQAVTANQSAQFGHIVS